MNAVYQTDTLAAGLEPEHGTEVHTPAFADRLPDDVKQRASLSIAELHEKLGRSLAVGHGSQKVDAGNHRYDMTAPSPLFGLTINDHVRRINAPALPDTPSIRALQQEWDETGRLLDEAAERYRTHRSAKLYRDECRQIIERENDNG